MLWNNWGRRTQGPYSDVARNVGQRARGPREPLDAQQMEVEKANAEAKKLVAQKKKAHFRNTLELEGKRKILGKGKIITIIVNGVNGIEKSQVSKMLRLGGINPAQVESLKRNDFRSNQAEVLFKRGGGRNEPGIDVSVSWFEYIEEVISIYKECK